MEKINKHEVDELLQYDWEKITAGFKAECLQSIVLSICDDDARLAVVRVCLTQYKYYLLRTNYDLFQMTWETCNPFRVLCEAMLCDFEATDKFRIARECPTPASRENEVDMGVFESEQAKSLLKRVEAMFFIDGKWNERQNTPRYIQAVMESDATYYVRVVCDPPEAATVTGCTESAHYEDMVEIDVTPATGWRIVEWSDDSSYDGDHRNIDVFEDMEMTVYLEEIEQVED